MAQLTSKPVGRSQRSVRDDWFARLPEEKQKLFDAVVEALEANYAMLSIALNEAFALRSKGELPRAKRQVAMASELFARLSIHLRLTIQALEQQAAACGDATLVAPLDPTFFQGETARTHAAWNLLQSCLLSGRSRFSHKLRALDQIVEAVAQEFHQAAEEIADGLCIHPGARWAALDHLHYDLNTCLREAIVVLKSFLRAVSSELLPSFRSRMTATKDAISVRPSFPFPRVST